MSSLEYTEWLEYFAMICPHCKGRRTIKVGKIDIRCGCQNQARRKHRLEQVDIHPPGLKYKKWTDFNGMIAQGEEIVGHLKIESALLARNKAFQYCFGLPYSESIFQNRSRYRCVQDHLKDGQNVIIAGNEKSGRTFLSLLILKEVSFAKRDLDYRWVRFHEVIVAARWFNDKTIDQAYLDQLSGLDFLFLDGVSLQKGGHNSPPDHIAMNQLFYIRKVYNLPTIMVCSLDFLKMLKFNSGQQSIIRAYGEEFFEMITGMNNVVIKLYKENEKT